eukprot:TRINITY_DN6423_c0_g1_i1.p1 TRINITY_DN6423_c0_g1~~TRINITY_DN6423_c0_g1_i1.p1  ORF type:complete len:390 (+),score=40.08 TRINITY_DN6423_c0_g1_i1:37-1170(+)
MLSEAILAAVASVEDLELHHVADWCCWSASDPGAESLAACQSDSHPVLLLHTSDLRPICTFQPQRFLATDIDDAYKHMWENVHTFSLLSGCGVHYATGVDAYDPFSSPALCVGGLAEEIFGKGYQDRRLLILVHGFHPAYTPDPLKSEQQLEMPVAHMQSLLMYCLQCSFPNAVIIVTHKHAKVRKQVGGPPLSFVEYEAHAMFGRIWNRVESSREEMFGENHCMVSNLEILPAEVIGPGGLDLHKAMRAAMMAGWPLLQFASNHCELTASLIFQTSTVLKADQHKWESPCFDGMHHGYRRAVGENFAGIVLQRSMMSEAECLSVRERFLRIVEESKDSDGSMNFHILMKMITALLGSISQPNHLEQHRKRSPWPKR